MPKRSCVHHAIRASRAASVSRGIAYSAACARPAISVRAASPAARNVFLMSVSILSVCQSIGLTATLLTMIPLPLDYTEILHRPQPPGPPGDFACIFTRQFPCVPTSERGLAKCRPAARASRPDVRGRRTHGPLTAASAVRQASPAYPSH